LAAGTSADFPMAQTESLTVRGKIFFSLVVTKSNVRGTVSPPSLRKQHRPLPPALYDPKQTSVLSSLTTSFSFRPNRFFGLSHCLRVLRCGTFRSQMMSLNPYISPETSPRGQRSMTSSENPRPTIRQSSPGFNCLHQEPGLLSNSPKRRAF